MTGTAAEAERLIDEAERRRLVLHVDHTFVYTPRGPQDARADRRAASLGDIYYYDSVRVNLGLFQHDVNVIWDLAVHDLSIMDYVLPLEPVAVSATGMSHVAGKPENIAYLTLFFEDNADRAHARQLAGARQGAPHADRRQPQDDRLRRPRAEREDQGLRQGHHPDDRQRRAVYQMLGRLPHRRHVGAAAGDRRGAADRGARISPIASRSGARSLTDGHAGLRVVRMLEAATDP